MQENAGFVQVDVGVERDIEDCVRNVVENLGRLDVYDNVNGLLSLVHSAYGLKNREQCWRGNRRISSPSAHFREMEPYYVSSLFDRLFHYILIPS